MAETPVYIEDNVNLVIRHWDFNAVQAIRSVNPTWEKGLVDLTLFKINQHKELKEFVEANGIDGVDLDFFQGQLPPAVYLSYFRSQKVKFVHWFEKYGGNITRLDIRKCDPEEFNFDDEEFLVSTWQNIRSQLFGHILTYGILPNLTSLHIPTFDFIQSLFQSKIPSLPKLKILEIGTGLFLPKEVDPESVNLILKSCSTSLQTLKLWIEPRTKDSRYVPHRPSYFFGIHQQNLVNLIQLDLSEVTLPCTELQILANVKFTNLMKLKIKQEIQFSGDDAQVRKLLENVKETLTFFETGMSVFFRDSSIPEDLCKVETLICKLNLFRGFESMDLLVKLPNLKSFTLSHHSSGNRLQIFQKLFTQNLTLQNHSLKILKLDDIPMQLRPFRRLLKAFPNLEILSIYCSQKEEDEDCLVWDLNEFLGQLGYLKKLKELKFTVYSGENDKEQNGDLLETAVLNNMPHLRALQNCQITCRSAGKMKLSQANQRSIIMGFLQAPSLKCLLLRNFIIETATENTTKSSLVIHTLGKRKHSDKEEFFWFSGAGETDMSMCVLMFRGVKTRNKITITAMNNNSNTLKAAEVNKVCHNCCDKENPDNHRG